MASRSTGAVRGKSRSSRIEGRFIALPHDVLDSKAYLGLSHKARSLLLELARQYNGHNNGSMRLSRAALHDRGWKSIDVIQSAKKELLDAELIFETFKGHRPNKASLYACTWWTLDDHRGYDAGMTVAFRKGAYRGEPRALIVGVPCPSGGPRPASIAPSGGQGAAPPAPPHGPMVPDRRSIAGPPGGHHLETPSAVEVTEG